MNKVWMLLGSIGFFPCLGWSSSPQADSGTLPLTAAVKPSVSQQAAKLLPQDATLPSNQDDAAVSEDLLTKQQRKEAFLQKTLEEEKEWMEQAKKTQGSCDYLAAIDREILLMVEMEAEALYLLWDLDDICWNPEENPLAFDKSIANLVKVVPNKQVAHDWASKIGHNYLYAYGPRIPKIALWNAIERALQPEDPSA